MKLIINTATTLKGGSVQVAASFISECRKFDSNEYHIILNDTLAVLIDESEFSANFRFYKISYRPATKVLSLSDQAAYFKHLENEIKPDVVFTTSGPAYWRPESPHLMGFNLAHHLYPESIYFRIIPIRDRLKWKLKSIFIKYYTMHDADAYVTQTDDINNRLRKWIRREKIFTVTNTYGSQYDNPTRTRASILPERTLDEKRFLVLSTYHRHKNLEILSDIVRLFLKYDIGKVRFVVTLPAEKYRGLYSEELRDSIVNVGPISPAECPQLYEECDYAFIPTLLECFTAAYPEAMVMGKPIITTDLDFARSICGDAALFYDPVCHVDAYLKIRELTSSNSLVDSLVAKGRLQVKLFDTAFERAGKYLEICKYLRNWKETL